MNLFAGAGPGVCLSSCPATGKAYKTEASDGRIYGTFTYALIKQLRTRDWAQVTYFELIDSLPVLKHGQQPQHGLNGRQKEIVLIVEL